MQKLPYEFYNLHVVVEVAKDLPWNGQLLSLEPLDNPFKANIQNGPNNGGAVNSAN